MPRAYVLPSLFHHTLNHESHTITPFLALAGGSCELFSSKGQGYVSYLRPRKAFGGLSGPRSTSCAKV